MSTEDMSAEHLSSEVNKETRDGVQSSQERGESPEMEPVSENTESQFVQPAPPMSQRDKMMQEEAKLKSKYPNFGSKGGSALLAKRMQQRQKYFDSGDYNMAKAKMANSKKPLAPTEKKKLQESIGDEIPTPDTVPARKSSIAPSKIPSGTGLLLQHQLEN